MRRVRSSVLQSVSRLSSAVRGRGVSGAPAAAPSFRGIGAPSARRSDFATSENFSSENDKARNGVLTGAGVLEARSVVLSSTRADGGLLLRGRSRRLISSFAASLALLAVVLVALAPPTEAASINGFIDGTRVGDVAVYTANDSDPANDKIFLVEDARVERLDVHGNFELMWGKDVISNGAPGDGGAGYEVCTEAVSGAAECQPGSPGAEEGEFADPQGVAVSQLTGHVYVMDRGNSRVQEFDQDGAFVRAWGGLGAGDGQFGETFAGGVGIAVDPVNGDIFVADPGNGRVQQFSATGGFLASFGAPGVAVGEFGESEPLRLTVDSNHVVYVSDSNDSNRVQRYDAEADSFLAPIACCAPAAGAPLMDGTTVGLEIDPDSDGPGADEEHLLVGRNPFSGDTVVQEIDIPTPTTDPVTMLVATHVYEVDPNAPNADIDREVIGIGLNPTNGYLYLATPGIFASGTNGTFTGCSADSSGSCSGLIILSADAGSLEASVTAPVAGTTSLSATGSANAGGGVASYRFEISTDGASWQDSGAGGYVSGLDDQSVSGELSGLDPNTFYRLRLVVRKQNGFTTDVTAISNEIVVLTDAAAPGAQTLGSTQRTDTSVRLRGSVDPNGTQTTYRFEYGRVGGSFDQRVPIPDGDGGSGASARLVVADVDELQPETVYQYRIVATNFVGITTGEVVTFTTDPAAHPRPPLASRAYELVSPADKIGGVGVGTWYQGPATAASVGIAAHEGERFAVAGIQGSILVDGAYAYGNDWALAERTPDGWISRAGSSRRAYGSQAFALISIHGATEDLSLTSWSSNTHTLQLFPEMESWEAQGAGVVMMVRDWAQGLWELFAPLNLAQNVGDPPIGTSTHAYAADGSAILSSSAGVRGLAGPGDPTSPAFPDLLEGGSVYLDEVTGSFSEAFPGDDGVRQLVNVCTSGTVLPARVDAGGGSFKQQGVLCPGELPGRSARLISHGGASVDAPSGFEPAAAEGVISADGSRVFFMSPDPRGNLSADPCDGAGVDSVCPSQLFVRQRGLDGTVLTRWISQTEVSAANGAAADQDASLMGPVFFEGASRDGDKVFFRTISPLTADDPNGDGAAPPAGGVTTGGPAPQSSDLYMYDLPDGPDGDPSTPDGDPAGGDLVRISAGPAGEGDCNSAHSGDAALRFFASDASRVYFTCAAPLPGIPVTDDGTITSPGGNVGDDSTSNLYLYEPARPLAQRWRFVARLPRSSHLGTCATGGSQRGSVIMRPGQDGPATGILGENRCVTGTQDGSLVTFFTDGRLTGDDPDELSGDVYGYDAKRDELTRLSAPQGGVGGTYQCTPGGDDDARCYGDGGIGTQSAALIRLGVAARPDGETLAFFQSRSRLVPEDTDEAYDVYQWHDGNLSLLSRGGNDTDGIFYLGNDRSGLNVYLATRDRLTWQDKDAVFDVYTARIGGGIPEPATPALCAALADACQGGGAGAVSTQPQASPLPEDGNFDEAKRKQLTIAGIGSKALKRAARTGILPVHIRLSDPGVVRLRARARIDRKSVKIAEARKQVKAAGVTRFELRLSTRARRALARGRVLHVSLRVAQTGASTRTATVRLERGKS